MAKCAVRDGNIFEVMLLRFAAHLAIPGLTPGSAHAFGGRCSSRRVLQGERALPEAPFFLCD